MRKRIVLSVPHTGTRTLKAVLGIEENLHFGVNAVNLHTFTGHAHIPVRNPFDTTLSWAARCPGEPPGTDLKAWDELIEFTRRHDNFTLHRIEDYTTRIGHFDAVNWLSPPQMVSRRLLVRNWLASHVLRQRFFASFYKFAPFYSEDTP